MSLDLPFVPPRINTGPWVAGYSREALQQRIAGSRVVLPICSLGTPPAQLAELAPLVLPPLYHEALTPELKAALVAQIARCFPFFEGTRARAEFRGRLEIVELPPQRPAPPARPPRVLAFGVDTTVEQHGPHLPLATDTIQTHAVLRRLAGEFDGLVVGPALEHGHLTWGLPFGFSIDLTPQLLGEYAGRFIDALLDWQAPAALYVADIHGSIVHRQTIQDALRRSRCARSAFRWLHDPLVEFAGQRGDVHAGGVETALVAHIDPNLVDATWWPARSDELVAGRMTAADAIALTPNLPEFIRRVEAEPLNGIVGDVRNARTFAAQDLFNRMLAVAREDVRRLLAP